MRKFLVCPFCAASCEDGTEQCPVCEQDIRIAILICSLPSPYLPAGKSWILGPRNYTVGKGAHCDIVIPDKSISDLHFQLLYSAGKFKIKVTGDKFPSEGKKIDIKSIHAGNARLALHYIRDEDMESYYSSCGNAFMNALSVSWQIISDPDINSVLVKTTDAILRISNMEKAFVFNVEEKDSEYYMECISARTRAGTDIDKRFCPISTNFCQRIVSSNSRVNVFKPETLSPTMLSSSIKRLNLQIILGVKLLNKEGNLSGLIYADSSRSFETEKTENYIPALCILAKFFESRLYHF